MKSAEARALQEDMSAAQSAVKEKLELVASARSELLEALTARRQAYNKLGTAAGAQVDCPEGSRQKIAGILAAIPIVEIVIARARSIAAKKAPAYTEEAGRGLGMASYHGYQEVSAFLRATGELNYCNLYFGVVAADWEERRAALLAVKDRIGGPRPGPAD